LPNIAAAIEGGFKCKDNSYENTMRGSCKFKHSTLRFVTPDTLCLQSSSETSERAATVLANVQLQLFLYHLTDGLDRPIDKLRNLIKTHW
jgi:hypothetical protein